MALKQISKQKLKGFTAGTLVSIATWWIVVDIRERILSISPIKNTMLLALILYISAYYIGKN